MPLSIAEKNCLVPSRQLENDLDVIFLGGNHKFTHVVDAFDSTANPRSLRDLRVTDYEITHGCGVVIGRSYITSN